MMVIFRLQFQVRKFHQDILRSAQFPELCISVPKEPALTMAEIKDSSTTTEMHEHSHPIPDVAPATAETQQPAWECMKGNPKVVMYSLISCMCALLWGYDIGQLDSPFAIQSINVWPIFLTAIRCQWNLDCAARIQTCLWIRL
jgi:hypothetical protein